VLWVRRYLDDVAHKRLILTQHKDLLRRDFLIDDRDAQGASSFGRASSSSGRSVSRIGLL
jgi:hypothetical protein